MSYTRRIFAYLILVALLPPAAMMVFLLGNQRGTRDELTQQRAVNAINRWQVYRLQTAEQINRALSAAAQSDIVRQMLAKIRSKRPLPSSFGQPGWSLDFAELLDRNNRVLVSLNRPGLIHDTLTLPRDSSDSLIARVEYDADGRHAAMGERFDIGQGYFLYGGRYIDSATVRTLHSLLNGDVALSFAVSDSDRFVPLEPLAVYRDSSLYRTLLLGGGGTGYALTATFNPATTVIPSGHLIGVTATVAIVSVVIALALGFTIAVRTKREVDNLVRATTRVAAGDFSTPVMAYEEGEFATLADSFSRMMQQLREIRKELAATQQIAAWQTVGRKIAHEVKNPLTPIALAADDIRRSYEEQLPDFEQTIAQNTRMISQEVRRLTDLLDEFVRFARMSPPQRRPVEGAKLFDEISRMYAREIAAGRLIMENNAGNNRFSLDPQQMTQLLINLIKNALETGDKTVVTVRCSSDDDGLHIAVSDTGPGFTDEQLNGGFVASRSTKPGGSGLGLLICHRIVTDHGGTMQMGNRPEGGARIEITIPRE